VKLFGIAEIGGGVNMLVLRFYFLFKADFFSLRLASYSSAFPDLGRAVPTL
jgi:hypothetical protein